MLINAKDIRRPNDIAKTLETTEYDARAKWLPGEKGQLDIFQNP